jgi:Phage Tail Collar Domain.
MSLKQLIYPLDLTGERQANRISERHVIGVNQYRAFSLKHGPFYTKGLTVKERNGTKPLRRGIDYECVFFYSKLAMLTKGLEIAGVIVIINPEVSTDIEVHANIVGGPYTHTAEAIQQAIEALELDNRNQYWREVVEKPDLFQPTPHIHDLGDVFGFQFIVDIIGQMTDVLMIGDNAQMVDIKKRIKALEDDLKRRFKEHFEDKKNPHKVTAHQANAYFKEEIDKFLEDVQKQFGENAETFSDVFRRIGEINDTIGSIQGVISSINAGQSRQDKQLNRFQKLLADLTRQIDAIKDEIKEIWAAIKGLRERDKELQASIDRNAERIQEETERNDDQDGEIRQLKAEDIKIYQRIVDVEEKNHEQDDAIESLLNRVKNNEKDIEEIKKLLARRGVGELVHFANTPSPEDQVLLANGAWLERDDFPELYQVIGTVYGKSGSRFRLPDVRGLFMRSLDNGAGIDPGRGIGSYQDHNAYIKNSKGRFTSMDRSNNWYSRSGPFRIVGRWSVSAAGGNSDRWGTFIEMNLGSNGIKETRVRNKSFPVYIRYR